ncbi:tRNA-specific adenosine deaminase TAD3 [Juglans microcarpa x Juglans regia]|uniref:tRNA-specific adenosine deaminase TAD3 n=1 Tax=Juglans microcarpa x Juglans regia TaxID=2249226 RepID=UPI001B7E68EB|nr:tRNA-specific adenosine deaminase TAD3 [Juglans microcarpa x Juglans regia]
MNKRTDAWQILHVPDKPPIPPGQQPTVNVLASVIEPKIANTLVRRLNQIAPLENLRHVKRVQKKYLEGGKTQLAVILCLACENDNQLDSMQHDVREIVNAYRLSAFITKVSKSAASSKEEWEEQCKLWPTSYHPPTYNIDGITGFSEEDSQLVFSFMRFAVELAKSDDGLIVNAAVIVDPSVKQVIASARDEICSWNTCNNKSSIQTSSSQQLEVCITRSISNVVTDDSLLSKASTNELGRFTDVSCLYPWRWAEQQLSSPNSCYWHPLRHAALVAIESSAARDRLLFHGSREIEDKSFDMEHIQSPSTGSPAKRQKLNMKNVEDHAKLDTLAEGNSSVSARPYLCTGYDIYLVWEPCTMCAMALVHQRIRRIFYAFTNPNAGALGSVHRLQGEKSLNHHYAVFRVLLPEEVMV